MSFVAPLWLAVAAVVGAGAVFAHLFSTTVPPQDVLPTVRFIPEGTPLTVLRTRRITDWWLLLLRLMAVALLGLALSGVHVTRGAPPRVVLLDVSRAVESPAAALDSALAAAQSGARLVAFDSAARRVSDQEARALRTTRPASRSRGSLSAAIAAAHRLLAETPDGRESTELVIVSPLASEEVDSATARLLALWTGSVRAVRVAPETDSGRASVAIRADGDDPVAAALASHAGSRSTASNATVRLIRVQPTPADSQWARSTGGALVIWPANQARAAADSQRGIATIQHVSIAPYQRERSPHPGRAIVRWTDGEPAATETALGRGCVRDVAVPVDAVGDVALRDSFRGIAQSLLQPCGGKPDLTPASFEALHAAAARSAQPGRGTRRLAGQERLADAQTPTGGLPLALAVVALGLLVVEQSLRVRSRATP
ncbi:MAG TPA: BatA domain-containing protein [Gemmatimonadaceae bacterium]|nr:BatA domain-containing protein [Gemmatimonadaceae bacterium]